MMIAVHAGEYVGSDLDELVNTELDARIRELELQRRQIEAELAGAVAVADRRGLHHVDGHRSIASYLRATLNWSGSEVARFRGAAKLVDTHGAVGAAWVTGRIGSAQVAKLSLTHANPQVAERLAEFMPTLLDHAEQLPYREFVVTVDRFVHFADADGTHDDRHSIEARTADVVEVAGELHVRAAGGSRLEAAEFLTIFDRFVEREFQADLATRRQLHATTRIDVAVGELRTLRKRRFDALLAIARAANAHLDAGDTIAPNAPLVSILIDQQTWSWTLAHSGLGAATSFDGESIDPFTGLPVDNDVLADLLGDPASLANRRCVSTNGVALRPHDVLRAALSGTIRRVVLGAKRRPIDLGRADRVFTGAARDAAKLLVPWCEHPGCDLPVELCQVDHSIEWYELGRTDQANAGVRCSGHNREKHRTKRRVVRSVDGRNYTLRGDGTIILPVGCRPPRLDDRDDHHGCDTTADLADLDDPSSPEYDRMIVEAIRNRVALLTVR